MIWLLIVPLLLISVFLLGACVHNAYLKDEERRRTWKKV